MSDDSKKMEKAFLDPFGVIHPESCPVAQAAWAKRGAPPASTTSGPAQVATDAYRDGWARIFGSKPTVGQA